MENQNDKSMERREIVKLVLKTKFFEVDKQKLINNSRYFAALLSANYMEFHQSEHIINYEIPVLSFEDFINWIHEKSLMSTINAENSFEVERFLILLELGVLFAVDDLIENVTNRLETHYLLPRHAIDIWLLAQDLSLNLLRDVSLSVCLDCFTELPYNSLYKLSKQNFLKLVGNINVRSTEPYLVHVIHEWMKLHQDIIPLDILKNKQPKILHSIISCESIDVINNKLYLHCWDGKHFFELTTFEHPEELLDFTNDSGNSNTLSGMQIIARGFNLYLSGGEFGIGSGKFNTKVWRYSLLSKKCMPCSRRHMVAAFLKNKLMLVGGVGQYRKKLDSVDIYNVHTGKWSTGAKIPTVFNSALQHLIFNGKLIIYDISTFLCVYCPNQDTWTYIETIHDSTIRLRLNMILSEPFEFIPLLVLKIAPCYIDATKEDELFLRSITEVCDTACCHKICNKSKRVAFADFPWEPTRFKKIISDLFYVGLAHQICERQEKSIIIGWDENDKSDKFYLQTVPIRNQYKFTSFRFSHSYKSFFKIMDPAELHTQSMNLDLM
ncbi:uncharacterized protein [Linepithema humile]|uniref:uncharacterized protein isoform X2 n=1 Tax=Linepithema humile TaxID=83485 RepID=UPI00351EED83